MDESRIEKHLKEIDEVGYTILENVIEPALIVFVPIVGPPITAYLLALSRWPNHPFGR